MKARNTFLKIITVTSSAALMAGLVAFEAGAFHEYLGFDTHTPPDSLKKDSTVNEEPDLNDIHFNSSKSMMPHFPETLVIEDKDLDTVAHPFSVDSTTSKKDTSENKTENFRYMGSSKSLRSHYVTEEFSKSDTLKKAENDSIAPDQPDPKIEKRKKRNKK